MQATRHPERGSALVISMLVTVILALLGISFLLVGETENRIARNEKISAQALYAAEAGVRLVQGWFDAPGSAVHFPTLVQVIRTERRIVDETDPYNPAAAIRPGDPGWVAYKSGIDQLFERPYRGSRAQAFMGTQRGPDMVIEDGIPLHGPFLDALSDTLFSDFPREGGGVQARISKIKVYAPPYIQVGTDWSRYGLATVRVVSEIFTDATGPRRVLGKREVTAVLAEAPYRGPYSPLHSCGDLTLTGPMRVHWGAITSERDSVFSEAPLFGQLPRSSPRAVPTAPARDTLYPTNQTDFVTFLASHLDGELIDDPWFRVLSGGRIQGAAAGQQPFSPIGSTGPDRSNLLQDLPVVACPEYDYESWKAIATSGNHNVHYYSWESGSSFRENGVGPVTDFQTITDGAAGGIYFFDTRDGLPPFDVGGDGEYDNLTPAIVVPGGEWSFSGLLYLNATSFKTDGVTNTGGPTVTRYPPGEPYLDVDQDGQFDPGEPYVNLNYGTMQADISHAPIGRDGRGPARTGADISFDGILYTNGVFEATGSGRYYGSVIARQGVTQQVANGTAPTPEIWWNESIVTEWPPPGSELPRTVITGWITRY